MMATPEAVPGDHPTRAQAQAANMPVPAMNNGGQAANIGARAANVQGAAALGPGSHASMPGAAATTASQQVPPPLDQGLPPDQLLMGKDSRTALQVLRSFRPSGWTSTDAKIFVQGVESSTTSGAQPDGALTAPAQDPVSNARRTQLGFGETTANSTPQFLSFDQLSSAIDVSRLAILKEFHCGATYTRDFTNEDRQIFARIYVFSQPEGAYGAYYLLRQGASTVVQRGDGSSEDDQGISFWQGRLFISIRATSRDDDEGQALVRSLADKLSASLTDHSGMPQIVNHLPFLMKVKGSDRIVMGPLSAKRFFPAPFVNTLDIKHCLAAAVADYQVQTPPDRLKLLYVLFPNSALALSSYEAYTSNLEGHAVSFEAPATGEASMFKSNGTFVLCRQSGARLAIIIGARKRASASLLANYLY